MSHQQRKFFSIKFFPNYSSSIAYHFTINYTYFWKFIHLAHNFGEFLVVYKWSANIDHAVCFGAAIHPTCVIWHCFKLNCWWSSKFYHFKKVGTIATFWPSAVQTNTIIFHNLQRFLYINLYYETVKTVIITITTFHVYMVTEGHFLIWSIKCMI